MSCGELNDDLEVVGSYEVTKLAELEHDLIDLFPKFVRSHHWHQVLKGLVTIIYVLEHWDQKGDTVSDGLQGSLDYLRLLRESYKQTPQDLFGGVYVDDRFRQLEFLADEAEGDD